MPSPPPPFHWPVPHRLLRDGTQPCKEIAGTTLATKGRGLTSKQRGGVGSHRTESEPEQEPESREESPEGPGQDWGHNGGRAAGRSQARPLVP